MKNKSIIPFGFFINPLAILPKKFRYVIYGYFIGFITINSIVLGVLSFMSEEFLMGGIVAVVFPFLVTITPFSFSILGYLLAKRQDREVT